VGGCNVKAPNSLGECDMLEMEINIISYISSNYVHMYVGVVIL
jgi:hypothetical protein